MSSTIKKQISNINIKILFDKVNKKVLLLKKRLLNTNLDNNDLLKSVITKIDKIKFEIEELEYSLQNKISKLSSDIHNKMELYKRSKIEELELFISNISLDEFIEHTNNNIPSLSYKLAITQTDRRRFIACSFTLLYFKENHPIKKIFLDSIKSQSFSNTIQYPYSQILTTFWYKLCTMEPIKVSIDISEDKIISFGKLNNIIEEFNDEQDIYKAFNDLRSSTYSLIDKLEPSIDDTIFIYYQLAHVGINNAHFIFKLLTTCEGINANEQDIFLNITYIKTSILGLIDDLVNKTN